MLLVGAKGSVPLLTRFAEVGLSSAFWSAFGRATGPSPLSYMSCISIFWSVTHVVAGQLTFVYGCAMFYVWICGMVYVDWRGSWCVVSGE